jgi:hypothetical protein
MRGVSVSLMRNGVVAAIYADEGEAAEARLIDYTVLHGIITHYAPLPVITCVVHSLLIRCGVPIVPCACVRWCVCGVISDVFGVVRRC